MINIRLALLISTVLLSILPSFAQSTATTAAASSTVKIGKQRFLPLSEVREGMKGTARTVFKGSTPEDFNVEILGILPGGIGPKQDLIVGRISGGSADRTSVFAGMSGSPVYIDGRLVGAISYSFPFSKEPICGITPIEQMISIFEQRDEPKSTAREPRPISFTELASTEWQPELPRAAFSSGSLVSGISQNSLLMAVAGQTFRPIGTPLTFTGIRQEALDLFAPELMKVGMIPVSAVGGAASIGPLKPADENTLQGGTSVSMQLTRGDYSLAAAGTVTLRDGNKIYAFGHPFLSLGTSDLPMAESSVVTVIPNINNSFKLAVPHAMVGAMTQDRATGVFGKLGVAPKMIPVKIRSVSSRGQTETLNFEVAKDEFLTPLLLNIAIYNTLIAQERTIGDTTVLIDGEISIAGNRSIKLQRRFTGGQATMMAAGSVALPVNTLLKSRFANLDISGIELDLRTVDGSNSASLERISVDRTEVRAGESLDLQLFARTSAGRIFVQKVRLTIPEDTPSGPITVTIGDGTSIQKNDAIQQFVPSDLTDLVGTMNRVKMPDRLYARIFSKSAGVIIGSNEMPNLPPSILATINNDRMSGGVKPAVQSVLNEIAIPPADFVVTGEQTLNIVVVR